MSDTTALLETNCPNLELIARGKVRDIYALPSDPSSLLFVATDRVSAFDVVMRNGIPRKGQLLNQLSAFWFKLLQDIVPNHMITCRLEEMPREVLEYKSQLEGRSMLVRKCQVVKCEAIVRGYLTGSALKEYQHSQTIHGISLAPGLKESAKFDKPLFTPSTKADVGDKDENIHPDQLHQILSHPSLPNQVSQTAIALFQAASEHAAKAGLILADTKFEFGTIESADSADGFTLLLIDEALTPDSSRFWPAEEYQLGKKMTGIDKQYLREWLQTGQFAKDQQAVELPQDVVEKTWERYLEAFRLLTGKDFV